MYQTRHDPTVPGWSHPLCLLIRNKKLMHIQIRNVHKYMYVYESLPV